MTVVPSSRIARSLSQWMQAVYRELLTAREEGRALDADVAWVARAIAEEYGGLSASETVIDANEAMKGIARS